MGKWETEFTDSCRVAHLGTIAADGRTHIVPVCFAQVEAEFVIAIDGKPKSGGKLARIANIERDPRCSLLWDRYDDNWTQLAWVRADGEARVLQRGAEMPEALAALRSRYGQYEEMQLEERPLIVFLPSKIVTWRWSGEGRARAVIRAPGVVL